MEISYELGEKDFIQAYSAHRNRTAFTKWRARIFVSIIVLAVSLLFIVSLIHGGQSTCAYRHYAALWSGAHVDCAALGAPPMEYAASIS